jgi:hypothetical protein
MREIPPSLSYTMKAFDGLDTYLSIKLFRAHPLYKGTIRHGKLSLEGISKLYIT